MREDLILPRNELDPISLDMESISNKSLHIQQSRKHIDHEENKCKKSFIKFDNIFIP